VWSRLGAEVTVVEMLDHIVPFADKQMASMLKRSLKKQGLDLREKTKVTGARVASGRVEVTCVDKKEKTETLTCEKLLVAVGRRPNTAGQGLEQLGVELDERGRVRVDERLRATAPNVFAIGDLTFGPMLAHKAEEEGVSVAEQVAEGIDGASSESVTTESGTPSSAVDHSLIPNVVYTHPELAQVGLTEKEAKEKGLAPKAGRFYFKASGRARTMGDDDGLVKVVAEKSTGRVLGVHIVGPHASELIGEATVAMAAGMTAEQLGRLIHAHPTLSEAVKEAALATDRLAIHG
jgi:dihydrolipoamide dehydrogenase